MKYASGSFLDHNSLQFDLECIFSQICCFYMAVEFPFLERSIELVRKCF